LINQRGLFGDNALLPDKLWVFKEITL